MIQEARSRSVAGIFRSSITLGRAVTTTVWSSAVMKAPRPITVSAQGTEMQGWAGGMERRI